MNSYTLPITQVTHDWNLMDSYKHAYREYLPKWLGEFATELAATPNSITATSTSSVTIGTGSKTFTLVEVNRAFQVGQYVTCVDPVTPTNWINGTVTGYSGTTLQINGVSSNGSGTKASWKIYVSGPASAGGGGGGSTTLAALTDVQESFFLSAGNRIPHVNSGSNNLGHTAGFAFDGANLAIPGNLAMQPDNYVGVGNNDRLLLKNSAVGGLWANSGSANVTIDADEDSSNGSFKIWANTNNTTTDGTPLGLFEVNEAGIVKCLAATGAFMPNRWTTAQRDLISAEEGMWGYNTTTKQWEGYVTSWAALGGGGGGASAFTGLSDVDGTAKGALRIPYWDAAGTLMVGTDNFRYNPATDVLYLGNFALDSAGELRIFNAAMSAYSSIKAANFVPSSDSYGLWRGPNDFYNPRQSSIHLIKATNGLEIDQGSTKVAEFTTGGVLLYSPASALADGSISTSTLHMYLDESGHNLKVRAKYSDGSTFKTFTIASD